MVWYLELEICIRCMVYHGMEILRNDLHLCYDCGISYWYVVLAVMDSWNEDSYL